MVQLEADVAAPARERVLDLSRLAELRGISTDGYDVTIGALTTYTELRHSPLLSARLPALAEVAATVGAAQIQNRGTIGGNVCNASPAGDTLPVLLAVDAVFDLGSSTGLREVAAREFWTGYRQTALRDDELLLRVRFPVDRSRHTRFRKVGTRAAQAISKVVMALSYRSDEDGAWSDVRVALGSVAPTSYLPAMFGLATLAYEAEDEADAQLWMSRIIDLYRGKGAVGRQSTTSAGRLVQGVPIFTEQERDAGHVSDELVLRRGILRLRRADFAGARADFEHVRRATPGEVRALVGLGLVDLELSKIHVAQGATLQAVAARGAAIVAFDRALHLDASLGRALLGRGETRLLQSARMRKAGFAADAERVRSAGLGDLVRARQLGPDSIATRASALMRSR